VAGAAPQTLVRELTTFIQTTITVTLRRELKVNRPLGDKPSRRQTL